MKNPLATLRVLQSISSARKTWSELLGQTFGGDRDIYRECGWKRTLSVEDYVRRYERQDLAQKIINAYPDATWRVAPEVIEDTSEKLTKFEEEWNAFVEKTNVFSYFHRTDVLCGLGRFSILLIGFDDGKELSQPCTSATKVIYLQPYSEKNITNVEIEKDQTSPDYGKPKMYELKNSTSSTGSLKVHASRVLHVAERLLEGELYGVPRLRAIYNRLEDIEKLLGGSAEMFWKGAFPGMAFIFDPNATGILSESDMEDQIEDYQNNLTRALKLQGMDIQELKSQVSDPSKHWDVQIQAISAATGIPKRILTGSERGELASTQDRENWNSRIDERRQTWAGPCVVKSFITKLISVSVLPKPEHITIAWRPESELSEKDKTEIAKGKATAIAQYVKGEGEAVLPLHRFLIDFLGYSAEDAKEIISELEGQNFE